MFPVGIAGLPSARYTRILFSVLHRDCVVYISIMVPFRSAAVLQSQSHAFDSGGNEAVNSAFMYRGKKDKKRSLNSLISR
jgi:hypothetical protein